MNETTYLNLLRMVKPFMQGSIMKVKLTATLHYLVTGRTDRLSAEITALSSTSMVERSEGGPQWFGQLMKLQSPGLWKTIVCFGPLQLGSACCSYLVFSCSFIVQNIMLELETIHC